MLSKFGVYLLDHLIHINGDKARCRIANVGIRCIGENVSDGCTVRSDDKDRFAVIEQFTGRTVNVSNVGKFSRHSRGAGDGQPRSMEVFHHRRLIGAGDGQTNIRTAAGRLLVVAAQFQCADFEGLPKGARVHVSGMRNSAQPPCAGAVQFVSSRSGVMFLGSAKRSRPVACGSELGGGSWI
jgi:hypothetical protein